MSKIHRILKIASALAGVSADEMRGPSRVSEIVRWRQAGMCVAREHGYSMTRIGKTFCRDHTTVLHALRVGVRRRDVAERMARIKERLENGSPSGEESPPTATPAPLAIAPKAKAVAPLPPQAAKLLLRGWSIAGTQRYLGMEW